MVHPLTIITHPKLHISHAGCCECGECKYDLFIDMKYYATVHESTLKEHRPELLEVSE